MPILYVNPSGRRRKRARVHGKIGKRSRHRRRAGGAKKRRKGRMPAALAAYWAKKGRGKKSKKARRSRKPVKKPAKAWGRQPMRWVKDPQLGWVQRSRYIPKPKRKKTMAKKRRRRARKSTHRRRRRHGGGRKRRSHRRRRRSGGKRRHSRRRRRKSAPRRRRRSRRRKSTRRRRRRSRRSRKTTRRRRRRSRRTRRTRMTRKMRRSRKATLLMPGGRARAVTVRMNPRRRRRSRRRGRRRSRRVHRRYGRKHYRRNPGGMLIDLAKRAAPVLIGLYGARLLVTKVGPRIPLVSRLGTFQGPALAIGAVLFTNFITKKVGKLAKYRSELLLGTGLAALDSLISTFAPASIKSMIGVGDVYDRALLGEYVQMPVGEYIQAEMGEYVAVGGVEEELGTVEEELGMVEEELGGEGSFGQGVSHAALLAPVPAQAYVTPVPTRSYVSPVPAATSAFDEARGLYRGIFAGG